jgi:DNA-nicking Smr family endonuclease
VNAKRDPEEVALFREAMRDVKPLARDPQTPPGPQPPRPAPRARFTRADRRAILEESLSGAPDDPALAGGEEITFTRPGVPATILRKLRRGQYRIQAEIDLHGLTVREAKPALRAFLGEALLRGTRCVRIVHGKGLRSGTKGPVLKHVVGGILKHTGHVLAVVSAPRADGGSGAVYVLLANRT